MIRIKTLSLPLITAVMASSATVADAAVGLSLSSAKTYRQTTKTGNITYKGGTFAIRLTDGNVTSIGGCNFARYYPPGYFILLCSPGTSGFLSSGRLGGATIANPYLLITGLTPALIIEPKEARRIQLVAAPSSTLPRPSGGFTDDSASVYYNLHTDDIREYGITRYYSNRNYNQNQRGLFESDIVPGAYRYVFPRLNRPDIPAVINATIYPMIEGRAKKNNKTSGFRFNSVNENQWYQGYVVMSALQPNTFTWGGITPSTTFAATDQLHFSLRALRNPKNPNNSDIVRSSAIFPAFENGDETATKVLLRNPYVTRFVTPPIFPSGTRAMCELELERNFQTSAVTYDFSTRRFQIPVIVVDRYVDYTELYLSETKKKRQDILADADNDGFNNLTEWILGSVGSDRTSVPPTLNVEEFLATDIFGFPYPPASWVGFNVDLKLETLPRVKYLLQRSRDQGKTWQRFVSEPGVWSVNKVTRTVRGVTTAQIQVRSEVMLPPADRADADNYFIQPPGTASHLYRVKVSLFKKKKSAK